MFNVKEISEDEATNAWKKSESASLFCSPDLLNALGYKTRFIGGYKNQELLILWPLIESNFGLNKPPVFSYYFGPFKVDNDWSERPFKKYRNNLELINCLIKEIEKIAPNIEFSIGPGFFDLRPFQWWNYNFPENGNFQINLKYTGRYSFYKKKSKNELIDSFRPDDKRKKIRKILKENKLTVIPGKNIDPDIHLEYYEKTLMKSNVKLDDETKNNFKKLLKLSDIKYSKYTSIKVLELFEKSKNLPIGFQLLLIGKKQVYAIAQSISEEAKNLNGNIMLTYSSLIHANENSSIFDFNGANSPDRADDKHAYGAESIQYFNLRLKK